MEVIAWVAIAIAVGVGGDVQVLTNDEPFKDKASCEALQVEVMKRASAADGLVAFGLSCAPVTVSDARVKKTQDAPKPTQKDLEKSSDAAHASPFRTTAL